MAELSPGTVISRGAEHVEAEMAGQTVMMSIPRGKYFALEGTARRIWELIAEPVSIATITERLLEEYDVEPATCEAEVTRFVAELLENGLAVEEGG